MRLSAQRAGWYPSLVVAHRRVFHARATSVRPPLAQQRVQVGERPQVPQLVRVDDRVHALDLALRDVEGHHADQPALAVEEQRTWLSVYLFATRGDAEAGEGAEPG